MSRFNPVYGAWIIDKQVSTPSGQVVEGVDREWLDDMVETAGAVYDIWEDDTAIYVQRIID